jgi:hypothetical protein
MNICYTYTKTDMVAAKEKSLQQFNATSRGARLY